MSLELRNISIGHSSNVLIESVSLSVGASGLCFIVGANGAGKSTLMRSMAGQHATLSGEVLVDQRNLHRLDAKTRARTIAYIGAHRGAKSRLSVSEYLYISAGAELRSKHPAKKWPLFVKQMCEQTGISDLQTAHIDSLSDGEYQKMLITSMLIRETPIMLMDEPLSHLDPAAQQDILSLFVVLAKKHLLIISSHHLGIAIKYADRVLAIDKQKRLIEIPASDLINSDLVKEIFGRNLDLV